MAINRFEARGFLKKHVNAVHCSNNMSLLQRKAANVLLANAYNDLLEKEEFFIDVKTLCVLMGFNSKNFYPLKEALKGLTSTTIEWGILEKHTAINNIHWSASALLAAVEIKNGICRYEYSNTMKRLLYHPEIYAQINLKVQSQFKSSYALALYENCSRYKNVNKTPWLQLIELKKILGAFGAVYDHYGSFRRRVLDIAVNEVNQKADFKVKMVLKKEGRAVIAIKFEIKSFTLDSVVGQSEVLRDKQLDEREDIIRSRLIKEFKVSFSIADKLISEHGSELVEEKMNALVLLDSYKSGYIKNAAGALVDRINNPAKYVEPITSKNLVYQKQKEKAEREAEDRKKLLEKEKINKQYALYLDSSVNNYLELLSEYDIEDLNNNFLSYCKKNNNNLVINKFIKGDRSSPMVKAIYNRFIVDSYLKGRIMSKDNFAKCG